MAIATTFRDPISVSHWVTQSHGQLNTDVSPGQRRWHLGTDYSAGAGDTDLGIPIFAAGNGTVIYAQDAGEGWGNVVIIRHELADGTTISTLYGHLQRDYVSVGDTVAIGQQIGTMGNANNTYAAHLHFEVYLGTMTSPGRGYTSQGPDPTPHDYGWIDPVYFLNNLDDYISTSSVPPVASISDALVLEGGALSFTISLDATATADTRVYYEMETGSASASDFVGQSGFVIIRAGTTSVTLNVGTIDDTSVEGSETMRVVLNSATNGVTIGDATGVGTITDNDAATGIPDITIENFSLVSTNITLDGTLSATWTVRNVGTADTQNTERTGIYLSTDNSVSSDDRLLVSQGFDQLSPDETDRETENGIALPSGLVAGTYWVYALADTGGGETNLENNFSNLIQITVDDVPPVPPVASISDALVLEGWALSFTISLDATATADTRVYYEMETGSASASDFAGQSGFVIIRAGTTSATLNVGTIDDTSVEGSETMRVVLNSATNGVTIGDATGVGTITDNDADFPESREYITILEESFDDGILNGPPWLYNYDVSETNGNLEIRQSETDLYSSALYNFSRPVGNAVISMSRYYHPGNDYYLPMDQFIITGRNGENLLIDYHLNRSLWEGDLNYVSDNYDHPRISLSESRPDGIVEIDSRFIRDINSSDYYDRWINTTIILDSDIGSFSVDLDTDGEIDIEVVDAVLIGATLESMLFQSYGWWTGHYSLIDGIDVLSFNRTNNLEGGAGDDLLDGASGEDVLVGNDGNDRLDGRDGNDSLYGGAGSDTLIGGNGDDVLFGGSSDNDLRDVVYGGNGNDNLDGGYGNDELRGDSGNDVISGGFGTDTVIGGLGNDIITGSALSDLIFGGDGIDFLNGGFGHDRVNGGAGPDKFFHLGIQGHGSDWIQDYDSVEGDVLICGIVGATRSQFQVNIANTLGAGRADVGEAFIIYRPTGQILWALVDGANQVDINVQIGGLIYDLMG